MISCLLVVDKFQIVELANHFYHNFRDLSPPGTFIEKWSSLHRHIYTLSLDIPLSNATLIIYLLYLLKVPYLKWS